MGISPSTAGWPEAANYRAVQASTGSVAAGAEASVVVPWASEWQNSGYTAVASVLEATAGASIRVLHIEAKTVSDVTVRVVNDAASSLTGTLQVIGMRGE